MKCAIIKIDRGNDVKPYNYGIAYKETIQCPLFFTDLRRKLVGVVKITLAGILFSEKGNPVSKNRKPLKIPPKPLPIVIAPDKNYTDASGDMIPTDVILIADPILYKKMVGVLDAWGKEQLGVPGQRGEIDG